MHRTSLERLGVVATLSPFTSFRRTPDRSPGQAPESSLYRGFLDPGSLTGCFAIHRGDDMRMRVLTQVGTSFIGDPFLMIVHNEANEASKTISGGGKVVKKLKS